MFAEGSETSTQTGNYLKTTRFLGRMNPVSERAKEAAEQHPALTLPEPRHESRAASPFKAAALFQQRKLPVSQNESEQHLKTT